MTSELTPTTHPEMTGASRGDGRLAEPHPPRVARRLTVFTVADGLMLLIGLLAVWLRFGELARLPLSAAEATAALASHSFWTAGTPAITPISPAYFTFTNLIMGLGADGDAAARFVPALFGVMTVLLPWLWRGRARPFVWLAAALFMAVSPLLTAVSRTAGGDAIALFALLLVVVAGLDDRMGRGRAVALGAGLGLGLTTSPLFYTGLITLLPAAWIAGAGRSLPPARRLQTIALSAAVTFLLVASFVLLYPAGIGAALRLFPAWLGQFGLAAADLNTLFSPWLALLRYEPAVFVLGVPAGVWAMARRNRGGMGLAVWLGLLLVVMVLQPGVISNAAAALLPGTLLVGLLAETVFGARDAYRFAEQRMFWSTAVGLLGLGALVLAAFGRFARLNLLTGENANLIVAAALAFVLAGLAVVLAMAWESAAARRGAFVGLAALLLFWQWGSAWQLSRLGANDPRERWVISATDDSAPVMISLLRSTSLQMTNSERDLNIFSTVESPVLDWYLRDFAGYESGAAVPLDMAADVVIAPAGAELALPSDYFGTDFGLTQRELPPAEPSTLSNMLKWLLFRESDAPLETERVVLWIRSDLVQ